MKFVGKTHFLPPACCDATRKGVGAHTKILSAYLTGVNWEIDQSLVVLDLVPNRIDGQNLLWMLF